MNKIFNLKSDLVYWFMAAFLCGVFSVIVFYALGFLVKNFNIALNDSLIKTEPVVRFNLEKIKELGI